MAAAGHDIYYKSGGSWAFLSPKFTKVTATDVNASGKYQISGADVIDASRGLRFRAMTSTGIADITNAVNTTDKADGKAVWDSTNNRIMVASGPAAADPWYYADGSGSVTPA